MSPTIYPTGTCFDDALDYLVRQVRETGDRDRFVLVHAIVLALPNAETPGAPYAHAWIEDRQRDYVWASGLLEGARCFYAVPSANWYDEHRPVYVARYSLERALTCNQTFGTFGPWDPTIKALCGGGGRLMGSSPATFQPEET